MVVKVFGVSQESVEKALSEVTGDLIWTGVHTKRNTPERFWFYERFGEDTDSTDFGKLAVDVLEQSWWFR